MFAYSVRPTSKNKDFKKSKTFHRDYMVGYASPCCAMTQVGCEVEKREIQGEAYLGSSGAEILTLSLFTRS
jgi:hypothetical protein